MQPRGLRERIAVVLYYEDNKRLHVTPWEDLSADRQKPWLSDAQRVLEAIQLDHAITPNNPGDQ